MQIQVPEFLGEAGEGLGLALPPLLEPLQAAEELVGVPGVRGCERERGQYLQRGHRTNACQPDCVVTAH